ncbi:MAG: hypothetical protein QOK35_2041 [Pseudonocardiales bacterium]|nr:hypothetical protein [Pseudonocardiales bacterium]
MTLGQRDFSVAATPASSTVSVTAVGDLWTHEVREIDVVPAARGGRYPTLCGQTIAAASMAEPADRRCHRCAELRHDVAAPRPAGLLRRLLGA